MVEYLTEELDGILLWCVDGLKRLIQNDYHFSISARSAKLLSDAQREQNNVIEFLDSTGYIWFDPEAAASSHDLFTAYTRWCYENADNAVVLRTFASLMQNLAARFGIIYDKNLDFGNGKRVRGFHGIEVLIAGAANSV